MKKSSLLISTLAITTLVGIIFAQAGGATTVLTMVEKMKAASHDFTLITELNQGQDGLKSGPLSGKKIGGIVTAEEYNRILEMLSEEGGSNGENGTNICADKMSFSSPVVLLFDSGNTTTDKNQIQLDVSTKTTIPTGAKAIMITGVCNKYPTGNDGTSLTVASSVANLSMPVAKHRICGVNSQGSSNNTETGFMIVPLADDKKSIYYSYNVPPTAPGGEVSIKLHGFIVEECGSNGSEGTGDSTGTSMVPGWPDAIMFDRNGVAQGKTVAYAVHLPSYSQGLYVYEVIDNDATQYAFRYNADGTFNSKLGTLDNLPASEYQKSISQLYTEGKAFNFVGGGGGTGGGNSGWADVPLTGTTDFEEVCEYRFKLTVPSNNWYSLTEGSYWFYANGVGKKDIIYISHSGAISHISSGSKTVYRSSGAAVANYTVTQIQKRCN